MNTEKWEKIRSKGKNRFVWVNGVLIWGLTTAILWSIMMEIVQPSNDIWIRPLIALIIFPIGGIAFGHFTWHASEKKYKAQMDKQKTE